MSNAFEKESGGWEGTRGPSGGGRGGGSGIIHKLAELFQNTVQHTD